MGLLRFGSYALACWLFTVPAAVAMGVRSWPAVLLATSLCVATFVYALWLRRQSELSLGRVMIVTGLTFATLASVSCWMGPFVLVPQASAIVTLWITLHSATRRERWMLVAMGLLSVIVPYVLQIVGVLPPSYVFADGNITIVARALRLAPNITVPTLLYTSLAFVALPPIFLGRMRDALSAAERQLFLQAWHLRQLLPERAHEK
jgi:serine/threonine-protein kinase